MTLNLLSLYTFHYAETVVYMLQSTEYKISPYLKWYWHTYNFSKVMQRRTLDRTKAARLLLVALHTGISLQVIAGLWLIYQGLLHNLTGGVAFGAALIVAYPVVWAHLLVVPLLLGRWFVAQPAEQTLIKQSAEVFANHPGIKIAIAGSYGKTTMKEILTMVLSEGLKVAATPANKNVSISHAQFAKSLDGNEDVLIIEYGEGAPGDVARFANITQPTHAIITGLAPAHLDQYKTLQAAGEDIFSVAEQVDSGHVYVNNESSSVKPFLKDYHLYDESGALGWKTDNIKTEITGTDFLLKKDKKTLRLQSGLIGKHQAGYLALVAALALELGLNDKQVVNGISKTAPFEHRMQPYQLGGAWIVDDTYNGNLEGIRAGTQLLKDIKAKRKIYVTPGLVDQGDETERVHLETGKLIAEAQPDLAVLMKNSVTDYIKEGLQKGKFKGELQIETNPLEFYSNLSHFVASGDLVIMQNDWTDNYT